MGEPREGTWIAGCRLDSPLGHGGMGTVWRAWQERADRIVALKLIRHGLSEDPGVRERFQREGRVAVALQHPSIVPVHDTGEDDRTLWILMQLIPGTDLRAVLQRDGRIAVERVARIMLQVADALDYAHDEHRLIHRDVKPENILLRTGGAREHAYLTDFGLAKALDATTQLTRQPTVLGTTAYIPPEGWQGEPFDRRGDVYALGCVAYEALSGSSPFARDTQTATMFAHINDPLPSLRGLLPDGPSDALHGVLARAVAKQPRDRYPSAGAFAEAFEHAVRGGSEREETVTRTMSPPPDLQPRPRRRTPVRPATVPSLPPAPPRRRRRTGLLAAVALAAAAVTVALVLAGGDDDPPTADGDRPDRTTATASAAAPRVPVPNATGRGELAEFTHFRTRIPPNWEVEGPIDVVRPQERLGDALVTTFRPKADAAPDRVTVAYFGAGEFTATSRVDRREANLQRGDAYRAGEVAETITVGPHTMIRWMFDTLDRGEWLRWERFAFDVGGVGFDVVAGGRPGAVADVARRMAEALDLLKACPTPVSGGSAPIEATDLVAINATCKEAQAVLAEAYFTCGAGRLCAEAGDGYTCAVENNRLRCRASGRREVTARLSA